MSSNNYKTFYNKSILLILSLIMNTESITKQQSNIKIYSTYTICCYSAKFVEVSI